MHTKDMVWQLNTQQRNSSYSHVREGLLHWAVFCIHQDPVRYESNGDNLLDSLMCEMRKHTNQRDKYFGICLFV